MAYQRVEVLTGSERRRRYTSAEKARMVDEAFRPGVVVTEAARRFGVHESLLYRWRRLMTGAAGASEFVAVTVTSEPETEAVSPADPETAASASALALPAAPVPAAMAGTRAAVEVALPGGTRLRLDGAVAPALATAVLAALVPPRRSA